MSRQLPSPSIIYASTNPESIGFPVELSVRYYGPTPPSNDIVGDFTAVPVTGIVRELTAGLLAWSLLSLGVALLGLGVRPVLGEFWRSFWVMTGAWGFVDGVIAWYVLVKPPESGRALAPILGVNAGLDVLYLLVAAGLLTRAAPGARGFGLAVAIQGAFLLAFDLFFWSRCAG